MFGITGHRDIYSKDINSLASSVNDIMREFRSRYPSSPFVILSSLASGSDQIITEAALQTPDTSLLVVLPGSIAQFESSLNDSEDVRRFQRLLQSATKIIYTQGGEVNFSLPEASSPLQPSNYQECSHFLALNCHLLLAAWDGKAPTQIGGTADTVYFKLRPQHQVNTAVGGVFSFDTEPGVVVHIPIRRTTEVEPSSVAETKAHATDGRCQVAIGSFEFQPYEINKPISDGVAEQIERLNLEFVVPAGSDELSKALSLTDKVQQMSDFQASRLRNVYRRLVLTIICLGFGAVAVIDLRAISSSRALTAIAITSLCTALIFWFWLIRSDVQVRYQQFRALAEGARVQVIWQGIGLKQSTAEYFLINHDETTDWIRRTLRTCWLVDLADADRPLADVRGQLMNWFDDQIGYFAGEGKPGAIEKARRTAKRLNVMAVAFLGTAFSGLLLNFTFDLFPTIESPFEDAGLVVWSFLLPVALGVASYAELMSFRSTSRRYALSLARFENAKDALVAESANHSAKWRFRDLGLSVGQQALQEVSDWLLALQSKKIKPIQ